MPSNPITLRYQLPFMSRLLLTSQAVEEAKRGQMQKLANKVAMLEKDNEAVQRAVQERLKEEERRIARFQEEVGRFS